MTLFFLFFYSFIVLNSPTMNIILTLNESRIRIEYKCKTRCNCLKVPWIWSFFFHFIFSTPIITICLTIFVLNVWTYILTIHEYDCVHKHSYLHEWTYLLDTLWSCISCLMKCNQGIDPAGHRKSIKFLVIKEKEKATSEEKYIYMGKSTHFLLSDMVSIPNECKNPKTLQLYTRTYSVKK